MRVYTWDDLQSSADNDGYQSCKAKKKDRQS